MEPKKSLWKPKWSTINKLSTGQNDEDQEKYKRERIRDGNPSFLPKPSTKMPRSRHQRIVEDRQFFINNNRWLRYRIACAYEEINVATQQINHNNLLIQEAETDWQLVQNIHRQYQQQQWLRLQELTRLSQQQQHQGAICRHCRGPHHTVTCVGLTVGERWEAARQEQTCPRCLNHQHLNPCSSTAVCQRCRGNHIEALCLRHPDQVPVHLQQRSVLTIRRVRREVPEEPQ